MNCCIQGAASKLRFVALIEMTAENSGVTSPQDDQGHWKLQPIDIWLQAILMSDQIRRLDFPQCILGILRDGGLQTRVIKSDQSTDSVPTWRIAKSSRIS